MPVLNKKAGPCYFCGKEADSNFWMKEISGDKKSSLVSYCDDCANKDSEERDELRTRQFSMLSMMGDK